MLPFKEFIFYHVIDYFPNSNSQSLVGEDIVAITYSETIFISVGNDLKIHSDIFSETITL